MGMESSVRHPHAVSFAKHVALSLLVSSISREEALPIRCFLFFYTIDVLEITVAWDIIGLSQTSLVIKELTIGIQILL